MKDSAYDILFEPVTIGPLTARNRFFQVPHCSGMGYRYPQAEAEMRRVKAAGGWAVISTQETEIHPTGDIAPYNEARLWDAQDEPSLRLVCDAVHAYGALAAVELCHNGVHTPNHYSREIPIGPAHRPVDSGDPVQARAMTATDIVDLRRWYVNAAKRAKHIGFDIIYVYAGHDMSLLQHFISRRHNDRADEYGGSLENRVRLLREVIEDTKDAVGDRCAVALRLAVDELLGEDGISASGEGHDIVALLAETPDLWDVNVADWSNDSQTARFSEEGYQEQYIKFVKTLTTKPVVGVGRYTSPDTMARVIKQGIMDFIGAARPSIADPYLPNKIQQGRIDDIRECIGCNICVSGDNLCVPMRCTQNPTIGEEWRKSWHPEIIDADRLDDRVLVIGGGVAGLEAARTVATRGADVVIAESGHTLGGRSLKESKLPGLSSWARIKDWRLGQIHKLSNVDSYFDSNLTTDEIVEFAPDHVVFATGASWRDDGIGRSRFTPITNAGNGRRLTPDDCLAGKNAGEVVNGERVVIYDDDGYYLGGVLAQWIAEAGCACTVITPDPLVSYWTRHTLEQHRIQRTLLGLGVDIYTNHTVNAQHADSVDIVCKFTQRIRTVDCSDLITVTARLPNDRLYQSLIAQRDRWTDYAIKSVHCIGDAHAPGTLAAAVYAGHRYGRELGIEVDPDSATFKRES